MLGEVIASGHKVLVFSSFVKYLKMVAEETMVRGWKYAMLTGLTADREQTIRHFQADPECRIFLISLRLESHRGRLCIYSRSLVECRC